MQVACSTPGCPVGSNVVVLRALRPFYGKTLADGVDTLTGSFINSFERALNAIDSLSARSIL